MAYVRSEPRRAHRVTIWDRLEYRFIVSIIFTFCLATTAVKRIAGIDAERNAGSEQSIFAEAKSVAHTAAGYAFKR